MLVARQRVKLHPFANEFSACCALFVIEISILQGDEAHLFDDEKNRLRTLHVEHAERSD